MKQTKVLRNEFENLVLISASIDFIHPHAFDNLSNLKSVDLDETCADKEYEATDFVAMKKDTVEKCGDIKTKLDNGYKTFEKQVDVLRTISDQMSYLVYKPFVSY